MTNFFFVIFFQTLALAQYKNSSARLKLAEIPHQTLSAVERQVTDSLLGQITQPKENWQNTKTKLRQIADNFTLQMSQLQTGQQDQAEACAIPVIQNISNQLGTLLFSAETYITHKDTFQSALTNAMENTCVNIHKKLSGKDDVGRYMGGSCC